MFGSQSNRRSFLNRATYGLGTAALWTLMRQEGRAGEAGLHFVPKAKRIIFIFMSGGPSHIDLHDPKPLLQRLHGQPVPADLLATLADPIIKTSAQVMASPRTFTRYGDCGMAFSDLLPHTGSMADEICMIRSMHTDQSNHDPAQLLLSCGSPLFGNPSMGAWLNYGLGSEYENLPGYVVLLSNSGKGVDAGTALWGSGFLPSNYRGVTFRSSGDPILHLNNPVGVSRQSQQTRLNAIKLLNEERVQQVGDKEIAARINAYEMAYRMQATAPELVDLSRENASTHENYGLNSPTTRSFGTNCLLARRMIERGVRFVQLFHSTWDDHSSLNKNLKTNCEMTDRPTAALLQDLKQRGMLDETLVVWAGEFGRTPMGEVRRGSSAGNEGRDHHPFAFSIWMAGGGLKRGYVHGATDDYGYHVTDSPVHVHDLQATILYLLGIDHKRLTYRHNGRDVRLTDVHGEVVHQLL